MRKLILALALGSAALSFGSVKEASAFDYPYCLTGRGVGSPGDCAYTSYGQCMASASGRGLSCNINPRVAFARQGRGGYGGGGYDGGYYGPQSYYGDDGYAPPQRRRYRREYVPY